MCIECQEKIDNEVEENGKEDKIIHNEKKDKKISGETKVCKCCREEKHVKEFSKDGKDKEGNQKYKNNCKVCDFIENNNLEIKIGWTLNEYKIILDNLINRKTMYINEILYNLNNKTLDDLVDILTKYIKIKNTPIKIKCICKNKNCNKEFGVIISKYLIGKGKFCSKKCVEETKRNDYIAKEGFSICGICREEKQISEFLSNSSKNKTTTYIRCKTCDWIKRNNKKYSLKDGWSIEEYKIIIDNILNEKITYINEIVPMLNNKTLNDLVKLLKNDLIVKNKPVNILVECLYCKKHNKTNYVKINLAKYFIQDNFFCDRECYHNYKREFEPKGENYFSYNSFKVSCDNCGKETIITPSDDKRNKHNFCSQECYWEFRSKYYVGDRANHVKFTPEVIEKMRLATTKLYSEGVFDRQTIPQKIINKTLLDLSIKTENEYNCKYYSIDNFLPEYNLMIEIMGDYFHANPLANSYLNDMQQKNIIRDKRKHTYIKKYHNIEILYLWEKDIHENPEICVKLILEYVLNKGILEAYNSFNYEICDNDLVLKKDIIRPYMKFNIEELKNITKTSEEHEKIKLLKKAKYYTTCNCKYCNKEIRVLKSRKNSSNTMFCSKECQIDYYKSKHITVRCDYCDKEIDIYKYQHKEGTKHFCNNDCKNNFLKKDIITTYCDNCGKKILRNENRVNSQEYNFCNKECFTDFRRKNNWSPKKKDENKWIKCNCDNCGKELEIEKYKYNSSRNHFCNIECKKQFGQIETICDNCKKEFKMKKSEYNKSLHHFCNKNCFNTYLKENPNIDNEKYINFNCEYCGNETTQLKSRYNIAKHHFCSKICSVRYYGKLRKSNNNNIIH